MFAHILVPLDGSSLAECVLPHAVLMNRATAAKITLLRVVEQTEMGGRTRSIDLMEWQFSKAEAGAYLKEVTGRFGAVGISPDQVLLEGQPALRVIDYAHANQVDLIVLSSHGRSGLSGWNVSSEVQRILWRARLSILLVPAYQPASSDLTGLRYRRILVPLDGSQRAECVLPLVMALAKEQGSQVLLAHVVQRPELPRRAPASREDQALADQLTERNRLEAAKYIEELRSRLPFSVSTHLLVSEHVAAALNLLAAQEKVDLLVISAHGYSGGTQWPYGSLAMSFIAYGSSPLLIVQDLGPEEIGPTVAELAVGERQKN